MSFSNRAGAALIALNTLFAAQSAVAEECAQPLSVDPYKVAEGLFSVPIKTWNTQVIGSLGKDVLEVLLEQSRAIPDNFASNIKNVFDGIEQTQDSGGVVDWAYYNNYAHSLFRDLVQPPTSGKMDVATVRLDAQDIVDDYASDARGALRDIMTAKNMPEVLCLTVPARPVQ